MPASCSVFGHQVSFWAEGETMRWSCERGCGFEGSKVYADPTTARRYASAFDRNERDDLGRRAPLSLTPFRLMRRFANRQRA
jgi:hypothetical protein